MPSRLRGYAGGYFRVNVRCSPVEEGLPRAWMGVCVSPHWVGG